MNLKRPRLFTNSIRSKALGTLLVTVMIAGGIVAMITYYVARTAGQAAHRIGSEALSSQAEFYLGQITQGQARASDLLLEQVMNDVTQVGGYIRSVQQNEMSAANNLEAITLISGAEGQLYNAATEISSVFLPAGSQVNADIAYEIHFSSFLELLLPDIFSSNPSIEAIYFATPHDLVRYYPNIDLGSVLPADFRATQRVWYTGSIDSPIPQTAPHWADPYLDATGLGLVTTSAMPVYSQNQSLLGVVGFDVTLNELKTAIESNRFLASGYSMLIDHTRHAIALPEQGYQDWLNSSLETLGAYPDLTEIDPAFEAVVNSMLNGEVGIQTVHTQAGRSLMIAYAPLHTTGWGIASIAESQEMLAALDSLQLEIETNTRKLYVQRIIPIASLAVLFILLAGYFVTNQLVSPIETLAVQAHKIAAGHWNIEVPKITNDEIGTLATAFQGMASQLYELITDLEKKVTERTRSSERRALQLRVAAEVARDASAATDLDELLKRAVELIRGRFGFYHAGIFLMDEERQYAELRAATGEPGRKMLQAGHRLAVGATGIVGHVTGSGRARIALDVDQDLTHYKNPFLPDTRSEMALPLKVGDQIIGALDVQSQHSNAFDEEDITVLQLMADQLAVAIQNVTLLEEYQQNLQELQAIYSQYSWDAWQTTRRDMRYTGHEYFAGKVHPLVNTETIANPEDGSTGNAPIQIPLNIRGQEIGQLAIWPAENDAHLPEEIKGQLLSALAERLSQALESARLFEETRRRAIREQLTAEISSRLRSSNNPQEILETAAKELQRALKARKVQVLVNHPPSDQSGMDA